MSEPDSSSTPQRPNPSIMTTKAPASVSQPSPIHKSSTGSTGAAVGKYSLSPLDFPSTTGARSPTSMPSSPTSIHSSTSAIFERDIEPPPNSVSSPLHPDPHHTARAVAHGQLHMESAVPSVLTAAVEALEGGSKTSGASPLEDISIIAPAVPSPRAASRSPSPNLLSSSPTPSRISRVGIPQRLASAEHPPTAIGIVPPTPHVNSFGFTSPIRSSSPPSATASPLIVTPPLPGDVRPGSSRPVSIAMSLEELSLSPMVALSADSPVPVPADVEPLGFSHNTHQRPPSPGLVASSPGGTTSNTSKRLSFISYNDLLNSTPLSQFPLSSLSAVEPQGTTLMEPKPTRSVRTRTSSRQSTVNRSPSNEAFGRSAASNVFEGGEEAEEKDGEWEREGFGTSMEERVEAALKDEAHPSQ